MSTEFEKLPKYNPKKRTMRYAGIGSRETPIEIQKSMYKVAKWLESKGYILRSGEALGADKAFEGANQPWEKEGVIHGTKDFSKSKNKVTRWSAYEEGNKNILITKKETFKSSDANEIVRSIAKEIHPAKEKLQGIALDLMARNTFQVFGKDLNTPVDFVLCWTPLNKKGELVEHHDNRDSTTGGTGQAISMASLKGIPVINMAGKDWRKKLADIINLQQKENDF